LDPDPRCKKSICPLKIQISTNERLLKASYSLTWFHQGSATKISEQKKGENVFKVLVTQKFVFEENMFPVRS